MLSLLRSIEAHSLEELAHRDLQSYSQVEDTVEAWREGSRLHPADALAVDPAAFGQSLLAQTGSQPVFPDDVTEELAPLPHVVWTVGRGH